MWLYKQTEDELWTVGQHDGERWYPESDHGNPDEAAARVHFLNGGLPYELISSPSAMKDRLAHWVQEIHRNNQNIEEPGVNPLRGIPEEDLEAVAKDLIAMLQGR